MKLTAKPNPNRPGFRATFRHPQSGKIVTAGLSTQDAAEAQRICNDVVTIFSKPALLKDERNPALLAYHFRAVAIVHGEEDATELFRRKKKPVLDKSDIDTLGARIIGVVEEALGIVLPDDKKADAQKSIDKTLEEFESQRYKEVQDRLEDAENRAKSVEPRMIELESELSRLRREKNLHVNVTVADAVKLWKTEYAKAHADITFRQASNVIDGFLATLPDGFKLGEVRSEHINTWMEGLERKDGTSGVLSPTSRKNRRAYLSTFFNKWAKRKYNLFESPLSNALTVDGVARNPENIRAIRRREDLDSMLVMLKPFPYWHAWFTMATLGGPRWAEMQWLKVSDVFIEDAYFRISTRDFNGKAIGTKTGRERSVPIERTVAMPIISAYLEQRQAEQKKRNGTPAERSHWLFPSLLPEHPYVKRKKSLLAQWSDNSTWRECWDDVVVSMAVAAGAIKLTKAELHAPGDSWDDGRAKRYLRDDKLRALAGTKFEYLGYGPAEWRHTFGTICFMCGMTGLEISRLMGNSPAIAERNYISGAVPGKRWEFKWS